MPEVNTQEIINEIKKKTEERGLTDDVLSFDDVVVEEIDEARENAIDEDDYELNCGYDLGKLGAFTELTRRTSRVAPVVDYGNKFKFVIKRILRKLKSIFTFRKRQQNFDLNVAKSLNQIEKFINEEYRYDASKKSELMNKKEEWDYFNNMDKLIGDLQNKIASLEVEIEKLKEESNEK